MPFTIVRQDITKMKVDAIVNAANTDLLMGGGVCGAIFKAAGVLELQAACDKLAPIKTGEAVITLGFGLPAKFIIHAAGPVYRHWNKKQNEQHLHAAYTNSLKRAVENMTDSEHTKENWHNTEIAKALNEARISIKFWTPLEALEQAINRVGLLPMLKSWQNSELALSMIFLPFSQVVSYSDS